MKRRTMPSAPSAAPSNMTVAPPSGADVGLSNVQPVIRYWELLAPLRRLPVSSGPTPCNSGLPYAVNEIVPVKPAISHTATPEFWPSYVTTTDVNVHVWFRLILTVLPLPHPSQLPS